MGAHGLIGPQEECRIGTVQTRTTNLARWRRSRGDVVERHTTQNDAFRFEQVDPFAMGGACSDNPGSALDCGSSTSMGSASSGLRQRPRVRRNQETQEVAGNVGCVLLVTE